jgi:hypothetical protein
MFAVSAFDADALSVQLIFLPGNLRSLNELAREARANYIIHTGDFGFYDDRSLERIAEKYVGRIRSCSLY